MKQIEIEIWSTGTAATAAVNDKLAQPLAGKHLYFVSVTRAGDDYHGIETLYLCHVFASWKMSSFSNEWVCSVFQQKPSSHTHIINGATPGDNKQFLLGREQKSQQYWRSSSLYFVAFISASWWSIALFDNSTPNRGSWQVSVRSGC